MADRDMVRAFKALGHLRTHGVLPVAGAIGDQSASFMAFVDLVEAETSAMRREEQDRKERTAQILKGKGDAVDGAS